MIKIRNLYKQFGTQAVLSGIDLDIEDGETIAIVGPSGTGKSVLLKIITGLLKADEGEVWIGKDLMTGARTEEEQRAITGRMGILFQAGALFDSLNLFDNVAFPLRYREKLPEEEVESRTLQRLEEVGLCGYETYMPGEVSISVRKRVGIARALVTNPEFLLFDEPNTGLDPQMGQEIYDLINETKEAFGFTGIVVSHEIPEVFQVCDRVAMIYEGGVQLVGSVEEFLSSDIPVVQQFRTGDTRGPIQLN